MTKCFNEKCILGRMSPSGLQQSRIFPERTSAELSLDPQTGFRKSRLTVFQMHWSSANLCLSLCCIRSSCIPIWKYICRTQTMWPHTFIQSVKSEDTTVHRIEVGVEFGFSLREREREIVSIFPLSSALWKLSQIPTKLRESGCELVFIGRKWTTSWQPNFKLKGPWRSGQVLPK